MAWRFKFNRIVDVFDSGPEVTHFLYKIAISIIACITVISQEHNGSGNQLRRRHNGCNSVSNHQPHHCLLNRLFRRRSKKTSKLRVTGLCAGNSPGTSEFPAQMASYAENVST